MYAVSTVVPPESHPVSQFSGTSGFVSIKPPDLRRPPALAVRNAAIIVISLVAIAGVLALAGHQAAQVGCVSGAKDLRVAEATYRTETGGYTDVAGLRYAGLIPDRPSMVKVRLVGPAGGATSFTIVSNGVC